MYIFYLCTGLTMKKRIVFDFTDLEALSDIEEDQYIELNQRRKNYTVGAVVDGIITVSNLCNDGAKFDCIYHYLEIDRIREMIKKGESLDLHGCYINGFSFKNTHKPLNNFNADYSFLDGEICLDFAKFNGDVRFWSTVFGNGNVSFSNAFFADGDVNFTHTNFGTGNVDFGWATFGVGNVDFFNTTFDNSDVCFSYANFGDGDIDFSWATFRNSDIDFRSVSFGNGNIEFRGTNFSNGNIKFQNAIFGIGDLILNDTNVNKVIFKDNKFTSITDLQFKNIQELIIQDCTIEKILKIKGAPKSLSFYNTANLGQIYINWEDNLLKAINQGLILSYAEERLVINTPTNLEKASQFRMLKENYHTLGAYDAEDKAYRAYMKFMTNAKWYRWPLKFFSLIGGYGTRPFTIILTMFVAWIAFAAVYCFDLASQFDLSSVKSFGDALYYSGITFLTIGYGDIAPAVTGTALRFVSIAEGFVGLFLMSYLTVAVVRKILR